jgi:hypothetical protein
MPDTRGFPLPRLLSLGREVEKLGQNGEGNLDDRRHESLLESTLDLTAMTRDRSS